MTCGCLNDRKRAIASLKSALVFFAVVYPGGIPTLIGSQPNPVVRTLILSLIFAVLVFLLMKLEPRGYRRDQSPADVTLGSVSNYKPYGKP
jgi:hypothetical protein